MEVFKKRIFILFEMFFLILSLSACGLNSKNKMTEQNIIKQNAQVIIDGIKNSEYESIKEIFSPDVKENYPELENDIAELMKFVDGDIVSYDPVSRTSMGGTTENGEWTEKSVKGIIRNIKTSNDKTYTIEFEGYSVYKENPDLVGVRYISIKSQDTFDETGYPKEQSIYYR